MALTTSEMVLLSNLPILDLDHPGAHDIAYRQRRAIIVQKAVQFHKANPEQRIIHHVDYTSEEHKVWRHVNAKLNILHGKWASSLYKEGRKKLEISQDAIPQLEDLDKQ